MSKKLIFLFCFGLVWSTAGMDMKRDLSGTILPEVRTIDDLPEFCEFAAKKVMQSEPDEEGVRFFSLDGWSSNILTDLSRLASWFSSGTMWIFVFCEPMIKMVRPTNFCWSRQDRPSDGAMGKLYGARGVWLSGEEVKELNRFVEKGLSGKQRKEMTGVSLSFDSDQIDPCSVRFKPYRVNSATVRSLAWCQVKSLKSAYREAVEFLKDGWETIEQTKMFERDKYSRPVLEKLADKKWLCFVKSVDPTDGLRIAGLIHRLATRCGVRLDDVRTYAWEDLRLEDSLEKQKTEKTGRVVLAVKKDACKKVFSVLKFKQKSAVPDMVFTFFPAKKIFEESMVRIIVATYSRENVV